MFTSDRRNNACELQPDMTMRLPIEINGTSHDKRGLRRQTNGVLGFYLPHCSAVQVGYPIFLLWEGIDKTKMSLTEFNKLEDTNMGSCREGIFSEYWMF